MVICSVSNLTLHERMLETSSYLRKLANASKQAAARHLSASEFPFSVSIAMVFSISTVNDPFFLNGLARDLLKPSCTICTNGEMADLRASAPKPKNLQPLQLQP